MLRDAWLSTALALGTITTAGAAETAKDAPQRVTAGQRSTVKFEGPAGAMELTVDDITRGQVMTSLSDADHKLLIPTTSMSQGSSKRFDVGGKEYLLRLKTLHNSLIGVDRAEFVILRAISEQEKIEKLIAAIEQEDTVTYYRGKKKYGAKEEADYLRKCRDEFGDEIETADEFISEIAANDGNRRHVAELPVLFSARTTEMPIYLLLRTALNSIEDGDMD